MQPRDPDDILRDQESTEERKLLNKLRLASFTAAPGTIQPFQPCTLAWKVVVPASVSSVLNVTFTLGNQPVSAVDSLAVSPLVTGAFVLTAHSPLTSRVLGTRVVQVDIGDCEEGGFPRASIQFQAQQVKDLFQAGSLSSRGDVAVQMLPPDGFRVKVLLRAAIENFYNADVDIALDVRVSVKTLAGGNRVASATLGNVSVDVIFHVAEHIFSLGAATAAQSLIQPLAADLIKGFLGPQIETTIGFPLQQAIQVYLDLWRGVDPAKRVYRLYSITADVAGLSVIGCPVPPPAGGGETGGLGDGEIIRAHARTSRRKKA
jgi:hypothetical protein